MPRRRRHRSVRAVVHAVRARREDRTCAMIGDGRAAKKANVHARRARSLRVSLGLTLSPSGCSMCGYMRVLGSRRFSGFPRFRRRAGFAFLALGFVSTVFRALGFVPTAFRALGFLPIAVAALAITRRHVRTLPVSRPRSRPYSASRVRSTTPTPHPLQAVAAASLPTRHVLRPFLTSLISTSSAAASARARSHTCSVRPYLHLCLYRNTRARRTRRPRHTQPWLVVSDATASLMHVDSCMAIIG